jgi:hypothetical protein
LILRSPRASHPRTWRCESLGPEFSDRLLGSAYAHDHLEEGHVFAAEHGRGDTAHIRTNAELMDDRRCVHDKVLGGDYALHRWSRHGDGSKISLVAFPPRINPAVSRTSSFLQILHRNFHAFREARSYHGTTPQVKTFRQAWQLINAIHCDASCHKGDRHGMSLKIFGRQVLSSRHNQAKVFCPAT